MASKKRSSTRDWQDVAKEAQEYRDASIEKVPGIVPVLARLGGTESTPKCSIDVPNNVLELKDSQIARRLAEDLLTLLGSGEITAVEVTTAFLRRASVAQKLTNCITELLPEQALARARELDAFFLQHKKPVGPLHGLPISVKEMIGMKGLGLNAGYVAWWGTTATENAHVLDILWNAGAVFYARTTQPQSMMHLETDNNLYGTTVNPYNKNVSSGGSSGGEGALIAMRGSCLGLGSDVGGSVRSPAANCGIYAIKPTAFRIPTDGWCSTQAGADPIPAVIGPMGTSLHGIKFLMKTIIDSKPWLSEPALIPMPWNPLSITDSTPLKIAIMWNDRVVTPHPPVTRALEAMTSKLRTLPKIEIVDWKPHLHDEAWAIISSLYYTDGGADDAATIAISGEPWRPLTTWMIKENPCVKKLTPQKLYYWQEEREAYRKEYAKVWNETANEDDGKMVDVILCPAAPGVAPKHNTAKYWGYTSQWNLLDYPAVVFPVDKVDKKRDVATKDFQPLTDIDEDHWKLYDAEEFDGLPISLQLVGRRFQDEKVLAVLEYIEKQINLPFAGFP